MPFCSSCNSWGPEGSVCQLCGLIRSGPETSLPNTVAAFRPRVREIFSPYSVTCVRCDADYNLGDGVWQAYDTMHIVESDEDWADWCWRVYWNLLAENLETKVGAYSHQLSEAMGGIDLATIDIAFNSLGAVRMALQHPADGSEMAAFVCPACQVTDPFGLDIGQLAAERTFPVQPVVDPAISGHEPAFAVVSPGDLPNYADVGGMEDLKQGLRRSIGLVLAHPEHAAALRVEFNGILLHGPPGTGKTHIARATAGEFGCQLIHLEVSQLISSFRGESAKSIVRAFDFAKAHAPAILFFDEFDAVARRRDSGALSTEDTQVLTQLLRSLESIRDRHDVIVLAATNDVGALDQAVTRPGRFDRQVRIDLPDAAARRQILEVLLRGRPVADDLDVDGIARRTGGLSAAKLAAVVNEAAMHVLSEISTGNHDRVIATDDLVKALKASGAQDRPLVGEWSWDELILADSTKRELIELQRLIEDPERAARFGIQPPRGALLYGPPGTGKTMIAKVLAAQAHTSFYPVSGSEIISKWLGESEQNVAQLWERAQANAPSIIFLDEIDAIAPRRGGGIGSGGDQAVSRVVNQLLQEIDGIASGSGVFVLGATNRRDMLDEALLRGGRLARHIEIPLPDAYQRLALLSLFTGSMTLEPDVDLNLIAAGTEGYSGADIQALCQQAGISAMMTESDAIRSADFRHALDASGSTAIARPQDLGLCDWHGPDTPAGCSASAVVEMGRRQYCGAHALVVRTSPQSGEDAPRYQA